MEGKWCEGEWRGIVNKLAEILKSFLTYFFLPKQSFPFHYFNNFLVGEVRVLCMVGVGDTTTWTTIKHLLASRFYTLNGGMNDTCVQSRFDLNLGLYMTCMNYLLA
jgi:hypothetical protein